MKQKWLRNMVYSITAVARLLFSFCIFAEATFYV